MLSALSADAWAGCPASYNGKSCGPSGGTNVCTVTGGGTGVTCRLIVPGGVSQAGTLTARTPTAGKFEAWGEDDEGGVYCCALDVDPSDVVYTMYGTDADDEMSLSDGSGGTLRYGRSYLYAYAGNDNIHGSHDGSFPETLDGGEGADIIFGLDGADVLYGQAGADVLNGGSGIDTLIGGTDADEMQGGDDNDYLDGGDGGDLMKGGEGNDTMYGYEGADWVCGGLGEDVLEGGTEEYYLFGGPQVDTHDGVTCNDYC